MKFQHHKDMLLKEEKEKNTKKENCSLISKPLHFSFDQGNHDAVSVVLPRILHFFDLSYITHKLGASA